MKNFNIQKINMLEKRANKIDLNDDSFSEMRSNINEMKDLFDDMVELSEDMIMELTKYILKLIKNNSDGTPDDYISDLQSMLTHHDEEETYYIRSKQSGINHMLTECLLKDKLDKIQLKEGEELIKHSQKITDILKEELMKK